MQLTHDNDCAWRLGHDCTCAKPDQRDDEITRLRTENAVLRDHNNRHMREASGLQATLARVTAERDAAVTGRVKPLVWDEEAGKSYRQANCILGQYQVSWLVEFECWQLSRPHMAGGSWRDGFSRHSSKDEAKAAAQADYEARILAALHVSKPAKTEHEAGDVLAAPTQESLK